MKNPLFHKEMEKSNRILYTPAPFAKNNLIYLQETGELKARKNHIRKRNPHKSYLFFTVLNGNGKIKYKNQDYIAKAGDCIFFECESEYSHESLDDLWAIKWVHFYGKNLAGIYKKYVESGGKVCFKSERYIMYDNLLDEIYKIAASDINVRDMKIYEKLVSLLTLLIEECGKNELTEASNTGGRELNTVKKFIDENYREKITLDLLAEKFYINKFYLTRLFKIQYGISIVNYILQVRITHAKQFLRFTDMSIESIGVECGFNDVNYFSRAFKNIEGITPGKFRKMW